MIHKNLLLFSFALIGQGALGAKVELHYDFTQATPKNTLGWTALVRDLPKEILDEVEDRVATGKSLGPAGAEVDRNNLLNYPEENSHWLINFGIFPLPKDVEKLGKGFLLQGNNHSDDLDEWIVHEIAKDEIKLKPRTTYKVKMKVKFASNATAGGLGVGGSEEGLSMHLGVTPRNPSEKKIDSHAHVRFAEGILRPEFSTGKTIENGLPWSDDPKKPYKIVTIENKTFDVETDEHARLWLMVGTHSGFESFQALYYTEVFATLSEKK